MKFFIGLLFLIIISTSAFTQGEENNNTFLKTINSRIDSLTAIRDSLTKKVQEIDSIIEKLKAEREKNQSKNDELTKLAEKIKTKIFLTNILGDRKRHFRPPFDFRPDKINIKKNNLGKLELECTMVDTIPSPEYWEKRGENKLYYSFWRFFAAIRLPTKSGIMKNVFSSHPNISRVRLVYKAAWYDYNEYGQPVYTKVLKRYEVTMSKKLSDKINYGHFAGSYDTPDKPTKSDFKKFYNTLKSTIENVWFEKRVRTDLRLVGIKL